MDLEPELSSDQRARVLAEFERRRLWRRACAFDGLYPSTAEVVSANRILARRCSTSTGCA